MSPTASVNVRLASPFWLVAVTIGLMLVSTACSSGSTSPTTVLDTATGGTLPSRVHVFGTVSAGPTCPVERAGHPCPLAPVHGTVDVETAGARQVADTRIEADGDYALNLAPGSYSFVVRITGGVFPRCPVRSVTMRLGAPVRVDIACDTGIR